MREFSDPLPFVRRDVGGDSSSRLTLFYFFSRLRPRVANKDLTVEMASQASQPVHSERKPRRAASPKSSATAGGFFSKDLENAGPRRAEDLLKLSGIMQLF